MVPATANKVRLTEELLRRAIVGEVLDTELDPIMKPEASSFEGVDVPRWTTHRPRRKELRRHALRPQRPHLRPLRRTTR